MKNFFCVISIKFIRDVLLSKQYSPGYTITDLNHVLKLSTHVHPLFVNKTGSVVIPTIQATKQPDAQKG